jgi:hypothetical protein
MFCVYILMFRVSINAPGENKVGAAGSPKRTFRIRGALSNKMHGKNYMRKIYPITGNRDQNSLWDRVCCEFLDGGSHASLFRETSPTRQEK